MNALPSRTRWTYLETVDESNSVIRVRGRVDQLGVDVLRGTIEELSRRGHRHITVTVQHLGDVGAYASAVLAEVAVAVGEAGGRLTVQWSPAAGTDDPDLAACSGRFRLDAGHRTRGGAAQPTGRATEVSVRAPRGSARPSSQV